MPWGGLLADAARAAGVTLDADVLDHLAGWYGTEAAAVLIFSVAQRLTDRLSADQPVLAGEIAYAVDYAAAERLSDAVMRRTALGRQGIPAARRWFARLK